jgi:Mrp family chromosome partitioning ATPase
MANLINDLRKQFDFVLLDTPALLAVSDASTIAQNVKLAENVDMFVLVVRQGRSEREPVRAAGKLIEKLPHEFAGVVLNDAAAVRGNDYYRS